MKMLDLVIALAVLLSWAQGFVMARLFALRHLHGREATARKAGYDAGHADGHAAGYEAGAKAGFELGVRHTVVAVVKQQHNADQLAGLAARRFTSGGRQPHE